MVSDRESGGARKITVDSAIERMFRNAIDLNAAAVKIDGVESREIVSIQNRGGDSGIREADHEELSVTLGKEI